MRQTGKRFTAYIALVSQLLLPACTRYSTYHGQSASGGLVGGILAKFNLGEKIFAVVRARLATAATNAQAQVAALDNRKLDFVNAVNAIVTPGALQQVGPSIKAFFGLVDDGTLPGMAANFADVLASIDSEPGQRTLKALVALGSTRSVLQEDDLLQFTARIANYPEIEKVFEAIATVIDGQPSLVNDVQAFASRLFKEAAQPPAANAGPGLFAGFTAELLVDAPPRGQVNFGAPSWVVRVDANGNPAVLVDPATGKLYAPFVDRNGVAAVDADGDPVDGQGQKVAIPAFGPPATPGRDAAGRALASSGALLYDYFDAKNTLLSHFLQLGGEGMRRGIHELALDTAEVALGPRVQNAGGFVGFDPGNPVTDLGWGVLENAKYQGVPKVLRAIAEVERNDPALAERVLVGVGKVLEKVRPIALAPSSVPPSAADRARTDQAIVLADRVFSTSGGAPSTGRELFDVVHQLGRTARDLPGQLALMIDYKVLVVDASGHVDPARSVPVDRTQPPTRAGSAQGENRSILEQVLDLLTDADQCKTFLGLFGAPLSETLIQLMAGQSASFVGTLIDFVDSPLVQAYLGLACSPIKDEVLGLKGLSASGALNGFLPIAKVFVDRGETRLLIDILKTLDSGYATTFAPNEAHVSDLLKSGGVEAAFDLDDLLVAGAGGQPIVDPASGDRVIDVIADAVANLLAHPAGGVPDRAGRAQPTRAHLMIEPLRRIEDAMFAAAGGQALANALGYAVTDLLIERQMNPATGQEELVNPSLTPFIGHACKLLAQNLPPGAAERTTKVNGIQNDLVTFMDSHDFATSMDLATTLRSSAGSTDLRDAVAHLLTPDPVAADDVFGALLKIAVKVLVTNVDPAPLRDLAAFAGDLFDPQAGRVTALVQGASRVLQADSGKLVISLVRNALNEPAPAAGLPVGESPLQVLLSVRDDVRVAANAGQPQSTSDRVAALAAALDSMVQFIRDPQGGLQRIFDVIKNRPVH